MGHLRDIHNDMDAALLASQLIGVATVNSASVDRQGFNGKEIVVAAAAAGDTLGVADYYEAFLQESDNNADWNACVSADVLFPADLAANGRFLLINTNAKAGKAYRIGYKGNKRYIRVVLVGSGTLAVGTIFTVLGIRRYPNHEPVAAPNTEV